MTDESEVLSREEALVRGLPRFRWDSQEAVRHEVAVEAGRDDPLRRGACQLDPIDHAAVDEVIRHYYAFASDLSAAITGPPSLPAHGHPVIREGAARPVGPRPPASWCWCGLRRAARLGNP
jgi:hypothetical protein